MTGDKLRTAAFAIAMLSLTVQSVQSARIIATGVEYSNDTIEQGGQLQACIVTTEIIMSHAGPGSLLAILFPLAFWHMNLGYFDRGLLGSWHARRTPVSCFGHCRFVPMTGNPLRS